jgi:hypothetical protein
MMLMSVLSQVYREAVASERCSVVHLTRVEADPPCDTHFPDITAEGEQRATLICHLMPYHVNFITDRSANVQHSMCYNALHVLMHLISSVA